MKKYTLLSLILTLILIAGVRPSGSCQLLLEENFDYPAGDLLTNHGWTAHSGAGTQPVTVTSPGLTFTGYAGSGTGNAALSDNTGEDVNRVFAVQSAGTVYTAFMVNVTTTAAGYFFHLGGDPIGSTFRGKVFMDATNHFGVSMGSNTGTFAASSFTNNTTYVLVLKYEVVVGTNNDIVSLFIFDSTLPLTEPATPAIGPLTDAAMTDINPGSVAIRQFLATQNIILDGIRVGTTWSDVLPSAVAPPAIQAHDLSFSGVGTTGMTASWINGDGAKRIVILNTSNSFTNPADGSDPVANPAYGGTGEQVVYNGAGNSVAVTGLAGSTTYWFRVYEYNGAGSATRYLTSTAILNPNSQATQVVLTPPVIGSPLVTGIGSSGASLGATITGSGGSAIVERGTLWSTTTGVTLADNKLAEGGTATGSFSHARSGMPAQTLIFFKAYATNATGTSLTDESSFHTLSPEPGNHVTGFAATATSNTSINLTWTTVSPGASGYLVLAKTGASAPTAIPLDGTMYSEGSLLGDAVVAAVVTPGSVLSQSITGLSAGTQYSFTLVPYAWDGTNGLTCNYLTTPVVPAATATTTGSASTVYTWQGANGASWAVATNWTPTRTTPAPGDILQFTDGTTKTITGVVTQTITQLKLTNSTTINLQSSAAAVLTITGAAGPDLDIPAGCALNLNATNAITLTLGTTATGNISGNVKFTATASTAHRLTAVDPGAIVFNSGAVFTAGPFFSGNAFGTSSLGSVIFSGGSTYLQQAGSNPFGAGQPNSVVVFQPGSLFKVMANLVPSFSGRTYADFEMDAPGVTLSPTGSSPVSIDHFTITNGTFNFNMTGPSSGTHQIHGNITVQAGSILNFNPSSASKLSLSGTTAQEITVNGALNPNTNLTLQISNPAGVTLNSPLSLNGNLELINGSLRLGANDLSLSTASAILGTPSASAMIVPTGAGRLQKSFVTGFSGNYLFPVGDETGIPEYSPVSVTFVSGIFSAGNWAGVNLANEKFPGDPNTTSYLNRHWTLSSSGITSFNCSALFQYTPADVTGTESQVFSMQVIPAPFTDFGLVNAGAHQVSAPGLPTFGTFTGSQPRPVVQTHPATLIGAITATLNGEANANYNATAITFEYGTTTAYGTTVPGIPGTVNGGGANSALANITGLNLNTTYHFRINGENVQGITHGNDLTFTTLCPAPSPAGTITGPPNVCRNGSGYVYQVAPIPYATSYNWSLPAGATITSGAGTDSITVSFSGSAVPGNITVSGISVCGTGGTSPAFAVTVIPQPVPVVAGPPSACINSSGNIYSTEAGMSGYTWTLSTGGSITAGAGTNSITVTWITTGNQTVSVSYTNATGCSAVTPTVYPVTVVALPVPAITGPNVVCANAANIVYTTEPGMAGYNWAVSIGGTIVSGAGTNAITVLWPYAGNRTVSVSYTNPTGCMTVTPTVYNVTVNPAAVPTIGSSNNPCINSTNNQYITNAGMLNYSWNVSPGGTLVSGQGTNTINVTWNAIGNQWVSVSYTNTFGCAAVSPTVYNLFVNPLPNAAGPVTGISALCAGTGGVAYSCAEINNAGSYSWTLPAGATIATGAGTREITVNYSNTAVSGNITVAGVNGCGTGVPSPAFPVTVNPIPSAPIVTVSGNVLTSSAPSGNQWYFNGTLIPNATGQSYTATLSGQYWCMVTLNGCSSPISNKVQVIITGTPETEKNSVVVYPVPNDGRFMIEYTCPASETVTLEIFNSLGIKEFESPAPFPGGRSTQVISLPDALPGIHSVVLRGQTFTAIRKVMIIR